MLLFQGRHILTIDNGGPKLTLLDTRSLVYLDDPSHSLVYSPRMYHDTLHPKIKSWMQAHPEWAVVEPPA